MKFKSFHWNIDISIRSCGNEGLHPGSHSINANMVLMTIFQSGALQFSEWSFAIFRVNLQKWLCFYLSVEKENCVPSPANDSAGGGRGLHGAGVSGRRGFQKRRSSGGGE
jgi:hypothetical protein